MNKRATLAASLERHSQQGLIEELGNATRSIHLGRDQLNATQHFLLRLAGVPLQLVGISSRISGTTPGWTQLDSGLLLLGYDDRLSTIDLQSFSEAFKEELLSIFFEFLRGETGPIALCETAVIGFTPNGRVAWRRDTDVIVQHALGDDVIEIAQLDGPKLRIGLRDGLPR